MFFKEIVFAFSVLLFSLGAKAQIYKLMVFGDSLSAGYYLNKEDSFASQLAKALKNKGFETVEVVNYSKSGETTARALKRQKKAIEQKPNGVILELGSNDVIQGVSIEKIEKNLTELIKGFQKNHIAVFLAGMQAPPITEPTYAKQFFNMYGLLARQYGLSYYPFFMKGLFQAAGNQYEQAVPYLLSDKVHPNKTGVSLMVQDVLPDIVSFLNKQGVYPQN